jgi:hypothetical protein
MREDMSEVIVERPRHKSRARYPRWQRRTADHAAKHDPDSLGFGAGMAPRRIGSYQRKSLNENLAPLRRYLVRQVNRPWDTVWSEICARLRPDSTVQQHVRDHIRDFVALKTFMQDGGVWVTELSWLDRQPHPLAQSHVSLYVDPRSGLLRKNKYIKGGKQRKAAQALERSNRMREVAPNVQVHRFGKRGWWEVTLAPTKLASYAIQKYGIDVVLGAGFSQLPPNELYGREHVYAIAKRPLTRQEIARLPR